MAKKVKQAAQGNLYALRCSECGRALARSSQTYLCCPQGHGKLIEASEFDSGRDDRDETTHEEN